MNELDGRYLYADARARHSRDPIALQQQVAYMRTMGEQNGWSPSLILVVVDEANLEEAGQRIRTALNGEADPEHPVESAA